MKPADILINWGYSYSGLWFWTFALNVEPCADLSEPAKWCTLAAENNTLLCLIFVGFSTRKTSPC